VAHGKYEDIDLKAYGTVPELEGGLDHDWGFEGVK